MVCQPLKLCNLLSALACARSIVVYVYRASHLTHWCWLYTCVQALYTFNSVRTVNTINPFGSDSMWSGQATCLFYVQQLLYWLERATLVLTMNHSIYFSPELPCGNGNFRLSVLLAFSALATGCCCIVACSSSKPNGIRPTILVWCRLPTQLSSKSIFSTVSFDSRQTFTRTW